MSDSSLDDLLGEEKLIQSHYYNNTTNLESDPILKKAPPLENLTPGRANLRKWLSRSFRIVITDGRILIGIFNCTDKDANIVLAMCAEYLEEGGDARLLGNVMIPGKHIVSIEVDLLGQNQEIP